jgi:hypothetical protein
MPGVVNPRTTDIHNSFVPNPVASATGRGCVGLRPERSPTLMWYEKGSRQVGGGIDAFDAFDVV